MALLQTKTQVFNLSAGDTAKVVRYQVNTKTAWNGTWARAKYLTPLNSVNACAPGIGSATFRYHYGSIKREDRSSFTRYDEIDILDRYVQILAQTENGSFETFCGVLVADSMLPFGGALGAGDIQLQALGLLHELDRDAIRSVKAQNGAGEAIDIQRIPVINERYESGVALFGNRSTSAHSDGAYLFSTDGERWSNKDVVEMILERHTPANGPTFVLGGQKSVLGNLHFEVEIAGRTPKSILDELIPRSRGIGYCPIVQGSTVILWVYTFVDRAVRVGDFEIPANAQTTMINLDDSLDIDSPEITRSVHHRFEKIEARGGPILSCFTLAYLDSTLASRWNSASQAALIAAAGSTSGNDNDDYRKDDVFDGVFEKHGLPASWNGLVRSAGLGSAVALPTCDDNGEVKTDVPGPFFPLGKRFEEFLPLEEESLATSGGQPSYRSPFALIEHPDTAGKYAFVDQGFSEFPGTEAHFGIYPREMAFKIQPALRHMYASGTFTPTSTTATNNDPTFDYQTLIATVAMYTDSVIRVVASRKGYLTSQRTRTKVLHVPDAELWYVVPNTVVGVDSAGALRRHAGGIVRDDRNRLREIAAGALAWFGKERRAITLPMRRIEPLAPLGSMVIGAVTGGVLRQIGTVITSIGFDYTDRRTTIQTEFAELDFKSIRGDPAGGSNTSVGSTGRRFVGREFSGRASPTPRSFNARGFNGRSFGPR